MIEREEAAKYDEKITALQAEYKKDVDRVVSETNVAALREKQEEELKQYEE